MNFTKAMAMVGLACFAVAASPVRSEDTLTSIARRGEFRIGHRESSVPFSFVGNQGEVGGYSVDICRHIYEQIKSELKRSDLALRFVALKPSDRIAAVRDGKVDVECGSTTNTVERQKDIAFSYTIFIAGARLLAKKSAGYKDIEDLRGKSVAVTEKTTTEKVLRRVIAERNLGLQLVVARDHDEAFALLQTDKVAAVANDDALLFGLVSKANEPHAFTFVGKYLSIEPYGIMFRKDGSGFERFMDQTMVRLFESGNMKVIYARWFENDVFKLPMNQYMRENLRLPNRYGVQ